jgi:hypothetical protein
MTTVTIDTRSFSLRVPVLRLGRLRGSVVVHVTERVELRLDEHRRRSARSVAARRAADAALARADADRTAALVLRLPL